MAAGFTTTAACITEIPTGTDGRRGTTRVIGHLIIRRTRREGVHRIHRRAANRRIRGEEDRQRLVLEVEGRPYLHQAEENRLHHQPAEDRLAAVIRPRNRQEAEEELGHLYRRREAVEVGPVRPDRHPEADRQGPEVREHVAEPSQGRNRGRLQPPRCRDKKTCEVTVLPAEVEQSREHSRRRLQTALRACEEIRA